MKIFSKYSSEVHNPNNASISTLCVFFLTHVYLVDSLKLLLCCKRAIVPFILVFVQSTILSMISLSKYKWKVSSMFSTLFVLEFEARQLILPDMVSHFRCVLVATGCSELHQILFVFFSFFGPRYHKVLPKHYLCLYIRFLCNYFHLMNCQCRERFDCE